jgi:hypothetical protein
MRKFLITSLSLFILAFSFPVMATELPKSSEQMVEYLVTLGYQCRQKTAGENSFISVSHDNDDLWNFVILPGSRGLVFSMNFKVKTESLKDRLAILEAINATNTDQVKLSQVFLYKHNNGSEYIMFNAWMPDIFDPAAFKEFVTQWQEDNTHAALALRDYFEIKNESAK